VEDSTNSIRKPGPKTASRRPWQWHKIALALVLIIPRAALIWIAFAQPSRCIFPDSPGYLDLASSLREEGRFHASAYEESLRTPVYPAFLALVELAFGERVGPIALLQILLTLVTAWILFRAGREIAGERAGLAAAWLYALNPNALFWSCTILTETLFAFWLILALYLLATGLRRRSLPRAATSGLTLGLAVLTRPIGLYLIPLWGAGALLALWTSSDRRRAIAFTTALLASALVSIFAWQARNYVVQGHFRVTASFRTVFIDYTAASTLGDALGIPRDEAATRLRQSPDAFAAAMAVVREYPTSFVRETLRGIARTVLGTEAGTWMGILTGGEYHSSGLLESLLRADWGGVARALSTRMQQAQDRLGTVLLAWGVLYAIGLYACAFVGLLRARHLQPPGSRWVVLAVALSAMYLIVVPLTIGDARFRLPAEPWLALLGALAFARPAPRPDSESDGMGGGR